MKIVYGNDGIPIKDCDALQFLIDCYAVAPEASIRVANETTFYAARVLVLRGLLPKDTVFYEGEKELGILNDKGQLSIYIKDSYMEDFLMELTGHLCNHVSKHEDIKPSKFALDLVNNPNGFISPNDIERVALEYSVKPEWRCCQL